MYILHMYIVQRNGFLWVNCSKSIWHAFVFAFFFFLVLRVTKVYNSHCSLKKKERGREICKLTFSFQVDLTLTFKLKWIKTENGKALKIGGNFYFLKSF